MDLERAEETLNTLTHELAEMDNPLEAAADATTLQRKLLPNTVSRVAELRTAFMREAFRQGFTLEMIGESCGITRQRVSEIVGVK